MMSKAVDPLSLTRKSKPCADTMRVGVLSYPGEGKTSFALTFPNPLVIDLDNKLPEGIDSFPFYDENWVRENFPKEDHSKIVNKRDALLMFFNEWLPKIDPSRTIIFDSWTQMMYNFIAAGIAYPDRYMTNEDRRTGEVAYDGRKFYKHVLEYATQITTRLKGWPGRSVTTFHIQVTRTEKGIPVPDTVRPYMEGQYADRLSGDFTFFLRLKHFSKTGERKLLTRNTQIPVVLPPGVSPAPGDGMIPATYEALCNLPRRTIPIQPSQA